jgi:hypothetical protein
MQNKLEWTLETVAKLTDQQYLSETETIAWIEHQKEKLPKSPVKPRLQNSDDIDQLERHIGYMTIYNQQQQDFDKQLAEINKINNYLDYLTLEYVKSESGFYKIPKIAQEKVLSKAYERYDHNYSRLYEELVELVELFADIPTVFYNKQDMEQAFFAYNNLPHPSEQTFEKWLKENF